MIKDTCLVDSMVLIVKPSLAVDRLSTNFKDVPCFFEFFRVLFVLFDLILNVPSTIFQL